MAPQRISFLTSETSGAARTEKMVIKADGKVGIGTTTPLSTLHLQSATPVLRLVDSDDTTNNLQLTVTSTQTQLSHTQATGGATIDFNPIPSDGSSTATVRLFRVTNTTAVPALQILKGDASATIQSSMGGYGNTYFNFLSGNLGIGINNPINKLEVSGNISISGNTGVYMISGNSGATGTFTTVDLKTVTVQGGIIVSIV